MIRSLWLAALVFAFVGTTLPAAAQKKGNPNRDCPNGTKEIARFEDTADIVPGKTIDGVTISDTTETAQDELSGGEWKSSVDLVALVIKGGGGPGGARPGQYVFFEPSRTGTFSNSVLDGQEISNLKFCGSKTSCPFSDFTEKVNYEESRVEITIEDTEGIDGLSFTDDDGNPLLNNLEVELVRAVDENGDTVPFTSSTSDQIDWQAPGDHHPTRVEMYLNQEDLNNPQVGYFLRTTNGCGTLTYIDPERTIDRLPEEGLDVSGSFPNPFQERTTIQFSLSDRSPVTISVYDVLGRQVATLVDRTLAAGAHEVQWDGRSSTGQPVSSGLYLYRVEVGPYSETRRMTLVR